MASKKDKQEEERLDDRIGIRVPDNPKPDRKRLRSLVAALLRILHERREEKSGESQEKRVPGVDMQNSSG